MKALWLAAVFAGLVQTASAAQWQGFELEHLGKKYTLILSRTGFTPVADDGDFDIQIPLLVPEGALSGTPPSYQVSARPTNLFLRLATTKAAKIVAREGDRFSTLVQYTDAEFAAKQKPLTALLNAPDGQKIPNGHVIAVLAARNAPSLAVAGGAGAASPAAQARPAQAAPGSTSTLSGYETAVVAALLVRTEQTECAKDVAACRSKLTTELNKFKPEGSDFTARELEYLKKRLGEDSYKTWQQTNTAAQGADRAAFVSRWRKAIGEEVSAYLAATDKAKYNPDRRSGLSVRKLAALTTFGVALYTLLPNAHEDNDRSVLERYYKGKPEEEKIKELAAKVEAKTLSKEAAASDPEFRKYRQDAAQAVLNFLASPTRDTTSPFASLPNDNLLLDFYCDPSRIMVPIAAGSSLASRVGNTESMRHLQGAAQTSQAAASGSAAESVAGAAFQGSRVTQEDFSKLAKRCADRKRSTPPPGLGNNAPLEHGLRVGTAPPNPIGANVKQATDEKDDGSGKRDIIQGAKAAIVGMVIGGILGGPIGLMIVGAIGFGLGWYMNKENNAK